MKVALEEAKIRSQLTRILDSPQFASADRATRFLQFGTEHALRDGPPLREYTIGVELFGRSPDFDPRLDAIVRVEASRLRSRLKEYYEHDGKNDALIIELPRASYTPVFREREAAPPQAVATPVQPRRWWPVYVAATLIILVGAVILYGITRQPHLIPPALVRLTADRGATRDATFSRDGRLLAFASDRSGEGKLDIWIQQVGGGDPIRVTKGPGNKRSPSLSPDGTKIAYSGPEGIFVVPALGGEPQLIGPRGLRPRFSPDGSQIVYWIADGAPMLSRIFLVPATGGPSVVLNTGTPVAAYPIWLPDGRVLFVGGEVKGPLPAEEVDWRIMRPGDSGSTATHAIDVFKRLRARPPVLEGDAISPEAVVNGQVYFSMMTGDAANLWRMPLNGDKAERLTFGTSQEIGVAVAPLPSGRLKLACTIIDQELRLWEGQIDPASGALKGEVKPLLQDHISSDYLPHLSRNGRVLTFIDTRKGFSGNIRVVDRNTGADRMMTQSMLDKATPVANADGTKIVYGVREGEPYNLYVQDTKAGAAHRICIDCGSALDFSPDGNQVLSRRLDRVLSVSLTDGQVKEILSRSGRGFGNLQFSVDGKWLIAGSKIGERQQVVAIPIVNGQPAGQDAWVTVIDGRPATEPRWSAEDQFVYFVSAMDGSRCIWVQRVDPATKRPLGDPVAVFHTHPDRGTLMRYAVGGDRLVLNLERRTSNLWTMELN